MKKEIEYCDLCDMDGEEEIAIARYTADDDEEYAVCEKHLKQVKELKMPFYLLDDE